MSETKVCQCWQVIDLYLSLEEVLATNYLLHSLYCERNIIKCEICDQRIDLNEKDTHIESHQKTECSYCLQMFEKSLLEMHKNNCPNKPEKCGFCDLMINLSEMPRHQAKCGSRTEQCQICKKHIQKREFNLHASVCGEGDQKETSKRNRLKRITSESGSDASVQEVKQITKRKPKKQIKQQSKQKEQILTEYNDDDDEDFQEALEHRHLSHPIHRTPTQQQWRSSSIPRFFSFSSVKQFPKLPERMRRKSCHCNQCGSLTTLQYRNMSVPFIKKVSHLRKQPSMNNNRFLTAQNTKKLFRKYSASRQDTLTCPSSSQLLLTTLRRASARSTEKLIEDTQIRIFEPPKSCRSHLLSNLQSEEIKSITLQVPKSQRIIKTQYHHNIKLLHTRSMPRIYTRNLLNNYLTKYKKKKTILHLQKN